MIADLKQHGNAKQGVAQDHSGECAEQGAELDHVLKERLQRMEAGDGDF